MALAVVGLVSLFSGCDNRPPEPEQYFFVRCQVGDHKVQGAVEDASIAHFSYEFLLKDGTLVYAPAQACLVEVRSTPFAGDRGEGEK